MKAYYSIAQRLWLDPHRDYLTFIVESNWSDTRMNLEECRDALKLQARGPCLAATVGRLGSLTLAIVGGLAAVDLIGAGAHPGNASEGPSPGGPKGSGP